MRRRRAPRPVTTRGVLLLALLVVCGLVACRRTPSCEAMGDHVLSLTPSDDQAHELRDVLVKRCSEDDWSADARRCLVGTTSMSDPKGCREHLTDAQNFALTKALAAAEAAERARTVPQACVELEALVAAVARCKEAPEGLAATLQQNLATAKQSWAAMPDKSIAEPECRDAITKIKQVVPARCGP